MAANSKVTSKGLYALALTRISLGLVFLWAFFDKLLGLGFATCRDATTSAVSVGCEKAWISGGAPTEGFLKFGTQGPFADFYQSLAGKSWVDWLFMIGLLGIGIGLTFGIAMKLSAWSGAIMLLLMWTAALWPANNPVIDDHIVYALALIAIYYLDGQQKLGLRDWWQKQEIVKKLPILA